MRRVALAVVAVALAVAGAWAVLPRGSRIDGCRVKLDAPPTIHFRGNVLELSFAGHTRGSLVDELRGWNTPDWQLSAWAVLRQPVEPGTLTIDGSSMGTDGSFEPGAAHDPRVRTVGVNLKSSQGVWTPGPQVVSGTLTIDVASETELRGRLELEADGELSFCTGQARVSTPFRVKLRTRSDEAPEVRPRDRARRGLR